MAARLGKGKAILGPCRLQRVWVARPKRWDGKTRPDIGGEGGKQTWITSVECRGALQSAEMLERKEPRAQGVDGRVTGPTCDEQTEVSTMTHQGLRMNLRGPITFLRSY